MDSSDGRTETPVPAGYVLVRVLGEGRTGSALLCGAPGGREVVLRAIDPQGRTGDDIAALATELRALAAAADHPCAVRTTRVWTENSVRLYTEQEFCPGKSLAGRAPVPPADAVVGASRLAAALAHLHARGVLHGDVRPSNVLIDANGDWRLADAGLDHALAVGPAADYAAREARGWEPPGPPADVYGLGATLHAALTGQPPAAPAGRTDPPVLPAGAPPALGSLISRMLADDPADRPALSEVDQVLRSLVAATAPERVPPPLPARGSPVPPRPTVKGLPEPPATAAGRRRGVAIAVGAAVLFFAGAGAVVATNGGADNGAAELAGAAPLATSATGAQSTSPAQPSPVARAARPSPVPGTSPDASGALVDQGLIPYRIAVFVYKGRLAVLLHMQRISSNLKKLRVYSVKPDGSDRRPGDDSFSDLTPRSEPRSIAFFFEPDVSTRRCVQIDPVLRAGHEFSDARIVCVRPLSAGDRILADDGWAAYAATQSTEPAGSTGGRAT